MFVVDQIYLIKKNKATNTLLKKTNYINPKTRKYTKG